MVDGNNMVGSDVPSVVDVNDTKVLFCVNRVVCEGDV